MKTFVDNLSRPWTVNITVRDAKRVQDTLGINLYGLVEDGFAGLSGLFDDPVRLIDVVYVLVKPQADAAGVDDESFGGAFSGDTIEAAAKAFTEAFADFFPNPRRRAAIRKLLTTSETLGNRLMERAEAEIDGLDVDSMLARLIASSGTSPASSGSTQGPSPSASST